MNWRVAILPISSMPRNVIIIKLKWHSPLKIQPPKRPAMLNALLLCMKIYHYSFTQSPTHIILYGGLLRTQPIFKQQNKKSKNRKTKTNYSYDFDNIFYSKVTCFLFSHTFCFICKSLCMYSENTRILVAFSVST